jgi:heptosyltransferase-2
MTTLVIAPNWIGDCLMAQPLLTLLKQQGQHITVLAPPWAAPIFRLMPEVDEVIEAALAHRKLQWRARWQLAKMLRGKFERAYVLPNSLKSALLPWLARIPQRIGYLGEQRYLLLNQIHRKTRGKERAPMVPHYAALALSPGASLPALANPALQIAPENIRQTRQHFQLEQAAPLIGFCPGAEYGPAKRWPVRYFAELARLVIQHHPEAQIVLLGSGKDKNVAEDICNKANLSYRHLNNLCGATRLDQACALLAACDAVVSNDSGLMHVSAALDRPLVAVFGSSDPRHTPPHSTQARVEWLHLECSPCFQRECPLGHLRCLTALTPERIWNTLESLLKS